MVPPIIALVLALAVAGLTFTTSLVDTKMADTSAPAASDSSDMGSDEAMDSEEAPADEPVDLGE
ncbi:hypothetical protein HNR46_000559 [Haloferula luteola]|uniref:Uncharacterized protein n=1 Tax=Haloferula luteola TaxID=595692 RepID=A0A840UX79_9BACT|nr:hypothetical protein [Haloferula luteola]MBB5350335.1 hypothetical protein [Haloferula luteola]